MAYEIIASSSVDSFEKTSGDNNSCSGKAKTEAFVTAGDVIQCRSG